MGRRLPVYAGSECAGWFLAGGSGAAAVTVTSAWLSPQRWTETYVRWSPKGTYLATFHQRGIALGGGEKFKQSQRFSHQGVQLIDFSPCER